MSSETSHTSISIRRAVAADAPLILELVKDLAEYEREPNAVVASVEDFLRDGFGEQPLYHVLIADAHTQNDVKPAGFALYFYQYSTWLGRGIVYLEDLFVRPEFRGFGIGRTLLQHLARVAKERGYAGVRWQVLDWNVDAIGFYERLGARLHPTWVTVRLEGDAMHVLAEGT